jgi:hypothetical protein
VYALFLVSSEDRYAHDVFREFRSSFQDRGAGFDHLIIFGQHGLSSTVKGFLAGFDLGLNNLPLLALFKEPIAQDIYIHRLPAGSEEGRLTVLSRLEGAVDEEKPAFELASIPEVSSRLLRNGPMRNLIGQVLEQVSEET